MRILALFRSLRSLPFALLWSGQTVSILGDKIFQVALAWWVLQETGSPLAMGTVLLLTTAPMLAFLLVGGALVDRYPRLRMVALSDVLRGAVIGIAALLLYLERLEVWHVYALSLVFGTVDAFFTPAFRAVLPEIVPEENLPSANSLTSLSGQVSGIVGPVLGAAVVNMGGTGLAFMLDGASFFAAAVCLLPLLPGASAPPRVEAGNSLLADMREGLQTVLSDAWLWVTIGVAGLSNLFYVGPMEVGLPFLIKTREGAGVSTLGLVLSLLSAGAVLGAVLLGNFAHLHRRGRVLYGAWMLVGLLVLTIGLPSGILSRALLLVGAFLIGLCNSILNLVWVHTLQEYVPGPLLGRVTSVDYLGSYLLLPVGFLVGGWAVEKLGAPLVFILGGACQALLVGAGLLHPRVRSLD